MPCKIAHTQFNLEDLPSLGGDEEQKVRAATSQPNNERGKTITSIFNNISSSLFDNLENPNKPSETPKAIENSDLDLLPPPPSVDTIKTVPEIKTTSGYDYDIEYVDGLDDIPQETGLLEQQTAKKNDPLKAEPTKIEEKIEAPIIKNEPQIKISENPIKNNNTAAAETPQPELSLDIADLVVDDFADEIPSEPGLLAKKAEEEKKTPPNETPSPKEEMPTLGGLDDTSKDPKAPTLGTKNKLKKNKHVKKQFGTNAANFDIAGIKLGMDFATVQATATGNGFELIRENREIPNFAKWQYEIECKKQGIYIFEGIKACIQDLSEQKQTAFIENIKYIKRATGETLEVLFTSNFTDNKVRKIAYLVQEEPTLGSGNKAQYFRKQWIDGFWKRIHFKYGPPDDKEYVTWGLGEDKPSLTATTGVLILADPRLLKLDYAKMYKADKGSSAVSFTF